MSSLHPLSSRSPFLRVAIVSVASLTLAQCDREPDTTPIEAMGAPATKPVPAATPVAPQPVTALTRGELVSAAGQAASSYALGLSSTETDPLDGRSFTVRIPFGCNGPSSGESGADGGGDGLARWSWGPERKTIRLSVTPGDWTGSALTVQPGPGSAAASWEAVEGFWVPQPWLASESCPTVQGDPLQTAETAASPQTIGIAAVFETGGSRIGRRNGKAYAFTVRPDGNQPLAAPTAGYRLLLEGRVVGFPGGRALRCRAPGPDQRPVCVVAVQLDKVTFEDAGGATLSAWRGA